LPLATSFWLLAILLKNTKALPAARSQLPVAKYYPVNFSDCVFDSNAIA